MDTAAAGPPPLSNRCFTTVQMLLHHGIRGIEEVLAMKLGQRQNLRLSQLSIIMVSESEKRRGKAIVSVDKSTNRRISDRNCARDVKVMDVEKWKKTLEKLKLDKEELRRYMFPCVPIEPWLEEKFTNALDGSRIYNSKLELFHVHHVSVQLANTIFEECYSGTGKYRSECDIEIGKPLGVKSLLFPSGKGYLVRRGPWC